MVYTTGYELGLPVGIIVGFIVATFLWWVISMVNRMEKNREDYIKSLDAPHRLKYLEFLYEQRKT